ncbi:MAG: flagellar hook capping FlgD N-terminal domain-containing protein [Anaeromyxobacteraceae bacterium]
MAVTSSISHLPSTQTETPVTAKNTLNKDSFLTLLTAQLQYQDPLNPMDNSAMVAQLAQFSSVEQLQNANSRLDTLALAQASNNQLQATGLVGKEVRFKTDAVTVTDRGQKVKFELNLDGRADETSVIISDSNGKVIRTLKPGALGAGTNALEWDGLDSNGNPVAKGDYTVSVDARLGDKTHTEVGSSLTIRGTVASLLFDSQVPVLVVNGRHVKLSDVLQVTAPGV